MPRNFSPTATRQHRYDRKLRIEPVPFGKLSSAERGADFADERVADELRGNASALKEFLLERKNAQRFDEPAADEIRAPGPPGPKLRADVVDVKNAARLELARQP